jgi:intein/homing endonuclease
MNTTTIEQMFVDAFGIEPMAMKINEVVDVTEKKIEILSFNEKLNVKEFKLIEKLIRKEDAVEYAIYLQNGDVLRVSKDHQLYVLFSETKLPTFLEVKFLEKFQKGFRVLSEDNIWVMVDKIVKGEMISIFDFEVRDNHNYFSNGVLSHNTIFGDPSTTTGGNALKFYATQRIKVTKAGAEKDGEETTAIKVKVDVVKNKIAPPAKKAELNIKFGIGIDKLEELVSLAVDNDILKKSGSWFSYGDTKLGQGRDAVKILLADNEELLQEIEKLVRVNLGLE